MTQLFWPRRFFKPPEIPNEAFLSRESKKSKRPNREKRTAPRFRITLKASHHHFSRPNSISFSHPSHLLFYSIQTAQKSSFSLSQTSPSLVFIPDPSSNSIANSHHHHSLPPFLLFPPPSISLIDSFLCDAFVSLTSPSMLFASPLLYCEFFHFWPRKKRISSDLEPFYLAGKRKL